jgi:uncharacterized protein YecE (DUF72 family)
VIACPEYKPALSLGCKDDVMLSQVAQIPNFNFTVDHTSRLSSWVDYCQQVQRRGVTIFAYANNHFAGHAPATVRQFRELWRAKGLPVLERPRKIRKETSLSLFDEPE